MTNPLVSVVGCKSYNSSELSKAIHKLLGDIHFDLNSIKGKKILIKPNLLGAHKPEEAITTHPVVIEELCKILKKQNCKIFIGESSADDTDIAFKICGMERLSKYGKIVNFDKEEKILQKTGGRVIKQVYIPKIIRDVDIFISMAKMKTHGLVKMTGAVKNLYGCIPGKTKGYYHKIASSEKKFCNLLVDIYQTIKPSLCIIDGIEALEGEGPSKTGTKRKADLLICSRDCVAADLIASKIMGFRENDILTSKYAMERGVADFGIRDIKVIGEVKNLNFKKPSAALTNLLVTISGVFSKPKLNFDKSKCIKCGLCARKCPTEAIGMAPYPEWHEKKCIRCLCCMEVCPKAAITKKESFLRELSKTIFIKVQRLFS